MQVHIAVELAAQHKTQDILGLWSKVREDEYMGHAVQETYETLEPLLHLVLNSEGRRWWVLLSFASLMIDIVHFFFAFVSPLNDYFKKILQLISAWFKFFDNNNAVNIV